MMLHNIMDDLGKGNLTVLMWVSSVFEMTWACSLCSLAIIVRLLIA